MRRGGLGSDYYRESVITTYTYGNGLVSQYTEEGGTEYYHYNNIGSTMYLTRNGEKTHEFAYSTYGELTKGEYGEVRFMYNGRLGVMIDGSGLYYMRARYYNPEIRRFINHDIVTGSIENSQSLNRYAYCQGNPVNYLDPFGLAPQSFGSWAGHTILNLLSFVPVFGNAADAFNAVWYLYEGNYAEAIACAVGAIPFIGNLATGFNIGSKVVKGCNIAANGGKAAIGFYNGVQNVMNIDHMIRTGTGRWYDYLGQGVQFGLNMFVSAMGAQGAWEGIGNLVGELNYKKMQKLAEDVSWKDIDGGEKLTGLLEQRIKTPVKTDFYVTSDGNVVPATAYRYISREASYLSLLEDTMEIPANTNAIYITFDKFDIPAPEKLQGPHDASIRVSFDTLQIIDDIRVPYGKWGEADWLEPVTKEFKKYGPGGATQAITNKKIKINKMEDLLK